jgi:HPt (histidine-containing phosphotransfer) domain-containing protein
MSTIPPPANHALPHDAMIVHVEADFEPLLTKFMTNRKKEVVTMREALAQQDLETVRKVAHGMKGAGGSYGFDRITLMAATIEHAAKAGTSAGLVEELDQLAIYLEQVHVIFD